MRNSDTPVAHIGTPQGKHGKCLKEKRKPEKLHSFTGHLEAGQLGSTGKPSHSANKVSLFGNRLLTGR